jgi:GNAT superfamily N-acetyltransferase
MSESPIHIRRAAEDDMAAVAALAGELAHSFAFGRERFATSYAALLATEDACLLVADDGTGLVGYLLGFWHLTFYANGPVAWVEEILVRSEDRGRGIGRALMTTFEQWAARRDCTLVVLATRRAEPFYSALGYDPSATYLRKVLQGQDGTTWGEDEVIAVPARRCSSAPVKGASCQAWGAPGWPGRCSAPRG